MTIQSVKKRGRGGGVTAVYTQSDGWSGGRLSTFSVASLLTTLLMNEPLIDGCDTYQRVVSHGLTY